MAFGFGLLGGEQWRCNAASMTLPFFSYRAGGSDGSAWERVGQYEGFRLHDKQREVAKKDDFRLLPIVGIVGVRMTCRWMIRK